MTNGSLKGIFKDELKKAYNIVGGSILFIVTFISFELEKSYDIYLGWIILFLSVFVIMIYSFYSISNRLFIENQELKNKETSSQIRDVIEPRGAAKDMRTKAVCLISPSKLFQNGNLVSFYYNYHEDLEYLIGFGLVTNAGEKTTQIELSYILEKHRDIVDKLIEKNRDVLMKTMIKPQFQKAN
jgi:hypothetical protein